MPDKKQRIEQNEFSKKQIIKLKEELENKKLTYEEIVSITKQIESYENLIEWNKKYI